jgi:ketosteroid isomerase-like protein
MKISKTIARIATGLVLLAPMAPLHAADDPAAATIRAGTETWVKLFNSGSAAALVALYAEDAVVMPPGAPLARGHAAIKTLLAKEVAGAKAGGVTFALGSENEVGVSGDLAWHNGTYLIKNKAGATVDTGKYLETWRKSGGKWRILRDIWNSDGPAAAAAPAAPAAPAAAAKPAAAPSAPPKK